MCWAAGPDPASVVKLFLRTCSKADHLKPPEMTLGHIKCICDRIEKILSIRPEKHMQNQVHFPVQHMENAPDNLNHYTWAKWLVLELILLI